MKQSAWHRLDLLARNLTPFGLTLLLLIVGLVPLHVPGLSRVLPLLPLTSVYHWAINRPNLLPAPSVFLLGVLQDILGGSPLGVNALVFLSIYGLVVWQNRFLVGKSFVIIWIGFALILLIGATETWLLVSAFHGTLVDARALAYQYLLTLGAFPPLAWLLTRWQASVLREE